MVRLRSFLSCVFAVAFCILSCGDYDSGETPIQVFKEPTPPPLPIEGTNRTFRMIVDSDMSDQQVSRISEAAALWSRVSSSQVGFSADRGQVPDAAERPADGVIYVVSTPPDGRPEGTIGYAVWWTDSTRKSLGAHIWIVSGLDDETFYLVALHEIGHSLGLDHIPYSKESPTLMNPSIVNDQVLLQGPTCVDIDALCALWECKLPPECESVAKQRLFSEKENLSCTIHKDL